MTDYTGPCPELALEVARMMVRFAGWKEITNEWNAVTFEAPSGDLWIVAYQQDHPVLVSIPASHKLFRPDLDYNQLHEVEAAIPESKRILYGNTLVLMMARMIGNALLEGDFWRIRHAPAWLCCVAALEVARDAAGGEE
jgi:hypothetical protein